MTEQVRNAMSKLPGWTHRDNAIEKPFAFGSFPDAVAFLVRLAFDAEAADHHPDVTLSYKRLTLTYSTHSEGGLTQKDIEGARAAERLASR